MDPSAGDRSVVILIRYPNKKKLLSVWFYMPYAPIMAPEKVTTLHCHPARMTDGGAGDMRWQTSTSVQSAQGETVSF